MSTRIDIDDMLARLDSSEASGRGLAAAELGDLLEADVLTGPQLKKAVWKLLATACRETDPAARESMYHALGEAGMTRGADRLNWGPIAEAVDTLPLDCLEHALFILGFAGRAEYEEKVRRFITHPDEGVRSIALDSLAQIEAKKQAGMPRRLRVKNKRKRA
jgi:hypothetical protein